MSYLWNQAPRFQPLKVYFLKDLIVYRWQFIKETDGISKQKMKKAVAVIKLQVQKLVLRYHDHQAISKDNNKSLQITDGDIGHRNW